MIMTEKTIDLDQHRGMAAQKATKLRRLLADVEANEKTLRVRQEELESHLLAAPAKDWHEAPATCSIYLRQRWPPRTRAGRSSSLRCLPISTGFGMKVESALSELGRSLAWGGLWSDCTFASRFGALTVNVRIKRPPAQPLATHLP
jgi:hypothetical protein